MKLRFIVTMSALWVLLGIVVLTRFADPFRIQTAQGEPRKVPVATVMTDEQTPVISGAPTRFVFERLSIDISIEPGYYDMSSQTWNVSKTTAQFATVTSQPNNKNGNTFLYGHNRSEVFSRLLAVEIGDTVDVHTDTRHIFHYTLTSIHDTTPSDTSYLQPTEQPTLTVQTCSGFFYENRRMLRFSLTGVQ